MNHLMDYEALRLDPGVRRSRALTSVRGTRRGTVRRRVGGWLVNVGSRLAQEEQPGLRTAANSS
jgi:hypothetical protein